VDQALLGQCDRSLATRQVFCPAQWVIPIATLLPPLTMPDYEARISAVPALGKRTERILGELGYSRGTLPCCGKQTWCKLH
jgi:hypothetical protein